MLYTKVIHFSITILMLFTFFSANGQNTNTIPNFAFYDAMRLTNLLDKNTKKFDTLRTMEYASILKNYIVHENVDSFSIEDIITMYVEDNNPLITNLIPEDIVSGTASVDNAIVPPLHATSAFESLGGLNVASFADGFAKFLIARSREELNIVFFNKFREELDKIEELRILFPQTYKVLKTIDIFRYSAFIQALRETFEKDLSSFITNLPKIKDVNPYKKYFNENRILSLTFDTAWQVIRDLSDDTHPGNILNSLAMSKSQSENIPNINNGLKLMNIFSQSMRSNQKDQYWLSIDSLHLGIKNQVTMEIYFGLLYQLGIAIEFKIDDKPIKFREIISDLNQEKTKVESTLNKYKKFVRKLAKKLSLIQTYIGDLQHTPIKQLSYNDYFMFYDASIDLIEFALEYKALPFFDIKQDSGAIQLITMTRYVGNIYLDVNRKTYSSLIINTVGFLDLVLMPDQFKKSRKQFLKYGTFMASLTHAQNSDEVKEAIEAAVLPVGSSSIKKKSCFTISLNSYLGGIYGSEKLKFLDTKYKDITGMTAPIGIEFSLGFSHLNIGFGSLSSFISIIDVGALTTYRFNSDSVSSIPEIELRNIFAPGIYVILGINGIPLSIGYACQAGPNLRDITKKDISSNGYTRHFGFIAVDIPLFNFYINTR